MSRSSCSFGQPLSRSLPALLAVLLAACQGPAAPMGPDDGPRQSQRQTRPLRDLDGDVGTLRPLDASEKREPGTASGGHQS